MTVNYYEVDNGPLLRDALRSIAASQDPVMKYGAKIVFLNEYDEHGNLCMMDFAQCTPRGPGHYSPATGVIDDFNMAEGDRFAENTGAILYCAARESYMAIEFKQIGARYSAIANYIQDRVGAQVSILPYFDPDVFDRYTGSSEHKKITFAVRDPSTFKDYKTDHAGLNAAAQMAQEANAGRISITLHYGDGRQRGGRLNIRKLVPFLRDRADGVDELKVAVINEEGKMEALNLLKHLDKSTVETDRLTLTSDDHGRYTYGSRIRAIREEFELCLSRR